MNSEFSNKLKAEARSLGFFACGIAQARPVDDGYARRFLRRVSSRTFADMEYMYRHVDLRLDPRLLVPGVQSIVSLALPYAPAVEVPRDELHLAAYALGKDYHDVMRQRMQLLVARLGITGGYRCFVDTAPVLEQYWAQQSGIGWIGRNQQLIIPHAGSQFFLMHADAPHLDGQYAAFGKITDNAQAAVDISRVNRDMFTDKPKKPQTIKSIRVDTQGVEYPAPEKH